MVHNQNVNVKGPTYRFISLLPILLTIQTLFTPHLLKKKLWTFPLQTEKCRSSFDYETEKLARLVYTKRLKSKARNSEADTIIKLAQVKAKTVAAGPRVGKQGQAK